jgi:hypothetical protein
MEAIIRKNPKLWMVAFYLFFVAGFLYVKPAIAFGEQGRVRPFGVGKRECTVFPVWWWMFAFAVMSYVLVAFLLNYDF